MMSGGGAFARGISDLSGAEFIPQRVLCPRLSRARRKTSAGLSENRSEANTPVSRRSSWGRATTPRQLRRRFPDEAHIRCRCHPSSDRLFEHGKLESGVPSLIGIRRQLVNVISGPDATFFRS